MKPLITTSAVLREIGAGLDPDALRYSRVLYIDELPKCDVIVHYTDRQDAPRVVINRETFTSDPFVPDHLKSIRSEIVQRMASLSDRASAPTPLSLPKRWHQYKYNNLITFFASSGAEALSSRWIVELLATERKDVAFWKVTTGESHQLLEEFAREEAHAAPWLDESWSSAFASAQGHFGAERTVGVDDVQVDLPSLAVEASHAWTFEQWMSAASADQRRFVEAPSDRSVRLKGPAGSGKTLALMLKAIWESRSTAPSAEPSRTLFVTHSWALATQVSDAISAMDPSASTIDVFPLLEIARTLSPHQFEKAGLQLIGEDSLSGKRAQLDEIFEVVDEFVSEDWTTYRRSVSASLSERLDSAIPDERLALCWDLLIEFGSVIGASAIFPGAGADVRYFKLSRASWMMPLISRDDKRVVFELYTRYMRRLEERSLVTSDQVMADFLSYLETHAWNRLRRAEGFDFIYVDEFHLFNPLERQVLHHLTRDTHNYPRIFMAIDPRQSPSEAFIGVAADDIRSSSTSDDGDGEFDSFELTTVHRFTPEILALVKHVHHEFPTLELGEEWKVDLVNAESSQESGPLPQLVSSASRSGEQDDIVRAVHDLYPGGRIALAVVDNRQWSRFSELARRIDESGKFNVATISGRSDLEGIGYRQRGVVVAPAEYLAGLQFATVLVAGVPNIEGTQVPSERIRTLSHLYLAITRAEKEVRIFCNDDDGGPTEVLTRAIRNELLSPHKGALT